ncbi:MAG TPA: PIN domain-containing protein [Spirochaetota bacterium]|nr:MAG: Ribonuclease VapC20 [Spirochaetes bacterium ADurb.Bin133]HNZ27816.1 PIN domain-containing protein [Spirochaetota bacterium]HPY86456.1 PIN domain-containing protein [Spirochaetota bacterium]
MNHDNIIFVDTGFFYSFLDEDDKNHNVSINCFSNRKELFVTSNYIIDELITLLRARKIQINLFSNFIDSLIEEKIMTVYRITHELELKSWKIMKKYKEHNFSFTDCTSFVVMKMKKINKVLTFDEHFKIMRFEIINEY